MSADTAQTERQDDTDTPEQPPTTSVPFPRSDNPTAAHRRKMALRRW